MCLRSSAFMLGFASRLGSGARLSIHGRKLPGKKQSTVRLNYIRKTKKKRAAPRIEYALLECPPLGRPSLVKLSLEKKKM